MYFFANLVTTIGKCKLASGFWFVFGTDNQKADSRSYIWSTVLPSLSMSPKIIIYNLSHINNSNLS